MTVGSCRKSGDNVVTINGTSWKVELALDEPTRTLGLGNRTSLAAGSGMLFVFPQVESSVFHMLNCHVPLDIAFVTGDLLVAEVRTMRVEPDPAYPEVLYGSRMPVKYALEAPAGEMGKAGVAIGQSVRFSPSVEEAAKAAR
jgi:uncharacterized membrane protein (UPF0127 family)